MLAESVTGITLEGILQLATSTGFCGLVWYLIAFSLPKVQERFDTILNSQSQTNRENIHMVCDSHNQGITCLADKMDGIRDAIQEQQADTNRLLREVFVVKKQN